MRVAVWAAAAAGAMVVAFAEAGGFVDVSVASTMDTFAVFVLGLAPAVAGFAAVGVWRRRQASPAVRGQAIDGWVIAGLLVWLFFARLESAHQLVGPTRHLGLAGAANLILLALAGFTVIRSWERAHLTGRGRAVATTAVAAALLMGAALYQDPHGDRSDHAARFGAGRSSAGIAPQAGGRVLFLAVDGLDWQMLQALSAVESLPVIHRLVADGRRWSLDPAGQQRSPEIWATIHTGRPPAAHGVWGFVDWVLWNGRSTLSARPYFGPHLPLFFDHVLARLPAGIAAPRLATADGLRVATFWEAAAADGVPAAVVAPFPFTSPLMALEGVMAVRDAGEQRWFLSRSAGGVVTETTLPEAEVSLEPAPDDDDDDLRSLHDQRVSLSMTLFRSSAPRLGVFYTSYLDEILHRHWRDGCSSWGACPLRVEEARSAAVRRAVRIIDRDLGRLIETFGAGATVVLVSDHGWELDGNEHVFGPDGVLVVSPSAEHGFGGRADIYEVAPTVLDLLGLPAESAMVARTVFDRPVRQRTGRVIQTQRLRQAARPSADRLDLLKSVGYIAR